MTLYPDPENYLNPPEAATRKRGGSLAEMGPKLRATMERLHAEAELRNAVAYAAPLYGAIDKMLGGTE